MPSASAEVPPVPLPARPVLERDREALADREGVEAVLRMVRVDAPAGSRLAGAATAFLLVHPDRQGSHVATTSGPFHRSLEP